MIEIGTQIGDYRIDGFLGQGGMAEVYRAVHVTDGGCHALKVLPLQKVAEREVVERFLREAWSMSRLKHSNIATIHAVGEMDGTQPYFVMELVEGGDLAGLVARRGHLPLAEALPILRQVAQALDYAHGAGYVHRDVKAANVLLKPDGQGGCQAKVVDFGIAKAIAENDVQLTRTGVFLGTPEYMSPEQAGNGTEVDYRTDQYSLGVLAYVLLCGVPPFQMEEGTSMLSVMVKHVKENVPLPSGKNPALTPAVDAALLRALAKHPAQRFASCCEFIAALEAPAPSPPVRSFSPAPLPSQQPARSGFPAVGVIMILVTLLGMGLICYGLMGATPEREGSETVQVVVPFDLPRGDADGETVSAPATPDAGEPAPEPQTPPAPQEAAVAPVLEQSLLGTWEGNWPWLGDYPGATLVVVAQDGNSFTGFLTIHFEKGPSQVEVKGTYAPANGNRSVQLAETALVHDSIGWGELSTSYGRFAADFKSMEGGFVSAQAAQRRWNLKWVSDSTSVESVEPPAQGY